MSFLGYAVLLLCWMYCTAERACEEPPPRRVKEVPTKRWDNPPYPHGTEVTYNCRPGYIKLGRIIFECIDGAWQQKAPAAECRNKPCGHPGDTEFGFFELTSGSEFVFGARVEYRCNDGYQMLSQRNYRECQADGWSNDIPHCEVVKCLPVEAPENGRIITTGVFELDEEYAFGQVVNFECNPKHKLVGAKEIICSSNGKWSNDVPQCQDIICEVPKILHGYVHSPKQSYKELEVLQFGCHEGYKFGERADAICTESGWNPAPYCTEIACSPPAIHNGRFRPQKGNYKEGDTITIQCDSGYHFQASTGKTTAKCTRDGWVPVPACVWKPCDYPAIENGKLDRVYQNNRYYFPMRSGQTLYYYCLRGYLNPNGNGWVPILCTDRGWSPKPKCLKICYTNQLENGHFRGITARKDFYTEGQRATYDCFYDYIAEHEEVTCTRDGWSPPPRCIREKKCHPINFENGYFSSREVFNLKNTASYHCYSGFVTPEGQEEGKTQCGVNGWTPPPKCINSCKATSDILIYHTNKTVFMPEDTIEYSCSEGYKTANNMPTDTTKCGINGEWSPTPQCLAIECEMLALSNGDFFPKKGKYPNGDVVKFTCTNKYVRVGPASSQCYYFGWFPPPPVCKEKARGCGPPLEITNGIIAGGSVEQYQHGDRKQYECNTEFKLVGSKEIECVDGQWSPPPSCIEDRTPCGSPSSIPNVDLYQADQPQFSHGDEVICGCKPGSDNPKQMKIKCLNGEWKPFPLCADPSPRCEVPMDVELLPPMTRGRPRLYKVIKYRCTSGGKNTKKATCVSGKWTPEIECTAEENVCPPPPQVSGAQQTAVGRNYRNGSKVAFSCLNGFRLIGAREITCIEGKWQSPPLCVERPCLPPEYIECADAPRLENPKLKIEIEGKTIYLPGAKLKYVSRSGYTLDTTEISCSMGNWTSTPECLEMPCGSIPKVSNADFEGRNKKIYEPGETIIYQCNAGFLPVGPPEIICREGNWTAPPFCKDVSCGPPPEIPNGHVASTQQERYQPGARVHYQCENNFQITGGNDITCINGEWSQAPRCRGKGGRCGPPPVIENGELLSFLMPEYKQGEVLNYKCPSLYILKGNESIRCINGEWTRPPVCLVACTASEEDMDRNNIQLKWRGENKLYSTSGDVIEFRCKPGYHEDPESSPFRAQCMEGRLEYPRCLPNRYSYG